MLGDATVGNRESESLHEHSCGVEQAPNKRSEHQNIMIEIQHEARLSLSNLIVT